MKADSDLKEPMISVVIPAHNEQNFIKACLLSLKNQSFELPYEVIVVDNNCTDSTVEIANSFRVRIVKERTPGISAAREAGTAAAKADIIAQIDADSIADKKWLAEIYRTLKSNPKIVGVAGPSFDEGWTRSRRNRAVDFFVFKICATIIRNTPFRGHNIAFRKSAWQKSGGYRPEVQYLDDVDFGRRLRKTGKILYNPNQKVLTSSRREKGMGWWGWIWMSIKCGWKLYMTPGNKKIRNHSMEKYSNKS
ncbi:glycosyltransferase [Candidatus Woesearchaeota archaeon]|nr:glycosyltransferase [Candidatus Woesearchaeota archaeon]